MTEQLCPTHAEPPPAAGTEALAVRPMMEQVARMGDCIGANTVGEIMAISQRASAWLAENPPGQPVAIEPRGCPIPGACSCVEPALPAAGEVAEMVAELRHFLAGYQQMRGLDPEHIYSIHRGDAMEAHLRVSRLARAAELLERQYPQPVPVSERLPGPEDDELLSLDQLRDEWNAQADAMNSWDELGIDEIIWWAQRQALARWGTSSRSNYDR